MDMVVCVWWPDKLGLYRTVSESHGSKRRRIQGQKERKKHTTAGVRWWSPTQLLICRSVACLWGSRRDPEFSTTYGRMWLLSGQFHMIILEARKTQQKAVITGPQAQRLANSKTSPKGVQAESGLNPGVLGQGPPQTRVLASTSATASTCIVVLSAPPCSPLLA